MRKLALVFLFCLSFVNYAFSFEIETQYENDNNYVAEWVAVEPTDEYYRLLTEDRTIRFTLKDPTGMEHYTPMPAQYKTNIYCAWQTPTGVFYDLYMNEYLPENLGTMPAVVTDWNSSITPINDAVIELGIPDTGPGIYKFYIGTTPSQSAYMGDYDRFKFLETVTYKVVEAGDKCEEINEAMQQISSPFDIPAYFHSIQMTYRDTMQECLAGDYDKCWAEAPCEIIKRHYGMCQDYAVVAAVFLEKLGVPYKTVSLEGPNVGHGVTIFPYEGQLYMIDNGELVGPASNLAELFNRSNLPDWQHFKILNSWKDYRRGFKIDIADYKTKEEAASYTVDSVFVN